MSELVGYSEGVSLSTMSPYSDTSCTSLCEVLADQRIVNGVKFGLGLHPVTYTDSMYCYPAARPEDVKPPSERRFRTSVSCELTSRPRSYFETCYILPKRLASTFVSQLEYGAVKVTRRWYSSAIRFFRTRPSCSALPDSFGSLHGRVPDSRSDSTSDVFDLPVSGTHKGQGQHCTVVEAAVGRCVLPRIAPDEDGVLRLELTADVNNNDGSSGRRDETSYRVQHSPGGAPFAAETRGMSTSYRTTVSVDGSGRQDD